MENEEQNQLDGQQSGASGRSGFKVFDPSTGKFKKINQDDVEGETSTFAFINSGNDTIPTDARRAARVHVMRQFHSNQKQLRAIGNSGSSNEIRPISSNLDLQPTQPTQIDLQASSSRGQLPSRATPSASASSSLVTYYSPSTNTSAFHGINESGVAARRPGVHVQNSFRNSTISAAVPILPSLAPSIGGAFPVSARSLELLQFSIKVVFKFTTPMNMEAERDWFTHAIHTPALFRGTLLLATAHQALLRNTPLPLECYQHQQELIRTVNINLGIPEKQLDQYTVAAVLCLGAFENITSQFTGMSVHMTGLRQIMSLRIERAVPDMPMYLNGLLHWVDLSHASANFLPALCDGYGVMAPNASLQQEEAFHASLDSQWSPDFPYISINFYPGMDELMNSLFHRIRQTSALASSLNNSIVSPLVQQKLTEHTLLLERQVNGSTWSPHICDIRITSSDIVRSTTNTWHCVVLTYIHVVLRQTPLSSRVVQKLVMRTREALSGLDEMQTWGLFPRELLLWALVVAGTATTEQGNVSWFIQMLRRWRERTGVSTWEDAREILVGFAWVEHLCERNWRQFWELVGGATRDGAEVVVE